MAHRCEARFKSFSLSLSSADDVGGVRVSGLLHLGSQLPPGLRSRHPRTPGDKTLDSNRTLTQISGREAHERLISGEKNKNTKSDEERRKCTHRLPRQVRSGNFIFTFIYESSRFSPGKHAKSLEI